MLRTALSLLSAFLCLFMSGCTPSSNTSAAASPLTQSLIVQIGIDGQWHELAQEMAYAHVDGAMMDGALLFVPLEVLLANGTIDAPVFPFTADFSYRILSDGSPEEVSCQPRLLQYGADGLTYLPDDALSAGALPEGVYLLRLDFHASRGEEYYNGSSFAWLRVGDAWLPGPFQPTMPPAPHRFDPTPTPAPVTP